MKQKNVLYNYKNKLLKINQKLNKLHKIIKY